MQKSDIQDHKPFFSNAATPETEATNLPRTSDSHSCHSGFLIHGFLHDRAATELKWLDDKTFQLEVETVGNDDAAQIELTFDGKSLRGRAATLGGYKVELGGDAEN